MDLVEKQTVLRRSSSSKSLHGCVKPNLTKAISANNLNVLRTNTANEDLEWDQHRDFITFCESETMLNYDLNEEMSEILKQTFLEFEFNQSRSDSISSISTSLYSTDSNSFLIAPIDSSSFNSSIEDIFKTKLADIDIGNGSINSVADHNHRGKQSIIHNRITNDLARSEDEVFEKVLKNKEFHRSMPNIESSIKDLQETQSNITRHLSLLEIEKGFKINLNKYCGLIKSRGDFKLNLEDSHLVDGRVKNRKISTSGSSVSFSRLSRLSKFRGYITEMSEKMVGLLTNTFVNIKPFEQRRRNTKHLSTICEETIETYDIIEIDDILETPGEPLNMAEKFPINDYETNLNDSRLADERILDTCKVNQI